MNKLDVKYKAPFIEDMCRFVKVPSRSFPTGGEEGALQRLVAGEMRRLGARVRTFEPDDVPEFRRHPLCCGPERQYRDRPTVLGEIGPEGAAALLIAAHSDTVPINHPEKWTYDPFLGEVRDGCVCGLGANDDKWGTATMITLLRALQDNGRSLRKRIIFASTIDEENGVGNGFLLLMLAGVRAEAGLYLDGGEMAIWIGNSGGSNLYLRPRSPIEKRLMECHAEKLAASCAELSKARSILFARPYFDQSFVRDKSVKFYQREDKSGPFFLLAFYTVPGEERAEVCRALEQIVSQVLGGELALYQLSYREPWFEPALADAKSPIVQLMERSVQAIRGTEPVVSVVSKQDVFVLHNHARVPTVSFGVSRLDGPRVFHQPDECCPVEDAWLGAQIAYDAVNRWLDQS